MAKNLINRYVWLIEIINRAESITFEEINRKWLESDWSEKKDLPLRTFHHHRKAIADIFGIDIECDKHNGNVYYIENKDDLKNGALSTSLLNTFAVNNLLNESQNLKSRILFENIPSGQRFLSPILEAMRDNCCIEITYQTFDSDMPFLVVLEPYCLKIFKKRWYVVGKNRYTKELRKYALDRIQKIQTVAKPFTLPKTFDAEEHFQNSFGIMVDPNIQPCEIIVKVSEKRRKYLQTLPLHHSQQEIESHPTYSIFSFYIAPTPDFKQELLSYSDEIEVLSPIPFRNEMAQTAGKVKNIYNKK
ncbi:WYL domain-containing protein [Bacteroidia bacterium]|nr:WYL domain-containing protein [Bacteroidia bacterium]